MILNAKQMGRKQLRIRLVLSLLGMCCCNSMPKGNVFGADKPELTRIFPSGGQLGTVVDVEATGKFPVWPVQAWSNSDSIRWSVEEASGKLKATIDPGAKPGLYWLRLFHESGATVVRPFLVSDTLEQIEAEPNNRLSEANEMNAFPKTLHGVLSKRGDVDMVSVQLHAGQKIAATVDAEQQLQSPVDASLQLLDQNGFLISECLDHFGLDPFLEFTAPSDGKYVFRILGFPAAPDQTIAFGGGDAWVYRLRLQSNVASMDSEVTWQGYRPFQLESGQSISRETALRIDLPAVVNGTIDQRGQHRFLRFEAKAGSQYRIQLVGRERGSELDATIAVLDAKGKQLVQQDDAANARDPDLKWKSPADGEYLIDIQDFHKSGGKHFGFDVAVSNLKPDFKLSIPNDLVQVTVGKETDLEVKVERESDFAGEINITLEGAPDSVQCPMVVSVNGKDTAKKVTLKIKTAAPFQGPVRVTARSAEMADAIRLATTENDKPIWLSSVAE